MTPRPTSLATLEIIAKSGQSIPPDATRRLIAFARAVLERGEPNVDALACELEIEL